MDLKLRFFIFLLFALPALVASSQDRRPRPEGGVWIMVNNLPGASNEVGEDLLNYFALRQGPSTKVVHPVQLIHLLEPEHIRRDAVLVLTDCGTLPLELAPKIEAFLDRGGTVLALGGTLFRNPIRLRNEVDETYQGIDWVTPGSLQREMQEIDIDLQLYLFNQWNSLLGSRNSNEPLHPSEFSLVEDSRFGKALHVKIEDLDGWDSWNLPALEVSPDTSQRYTSFWAKGASQTTKLAVEWKESDGSRWFATVPLETGWKRYLLPEKAFRYWESIPDRKDTEFHLNRAAEISFGLALSHTSPLSGDHEFWVAEVGTTTGEGIPDIDWSFELSEMEFLFPHYITYETTDVKSIEVCSAQGLISGDRKIMCPNPLRTYYPRPAAFGQDPQRKRRWIPLLEARSENGAFRGVIAGLQVGKDLQSMWAGVSVEDPQFYRQEPMLDIIRQLIIRMGQGDLLWEAGATQSTYLAGDPVQFGASVYHRNSPHGETFLRVTIAGADNGRVIYLRDFPKGKYDIGSATSEEIDIRPGKSYTLSTALIQDEQQTGKERVLDRIEQPVRSWEPDSTLKWVTVSDGEFRVGGKIWRPYGVNYMPSSGVALHDWRAFEYWLEPAGYDPVIIDRDLSRIAGLGMNMVSVFIYHRSLEHYNLIDFLYRCEKYGLRVNLSLRPGTPLDFPWEEVKELIEKNGLAENPNVFAFDLAWEPNFKDHESRRAHTQDWNRWVIETYGSLESGEKAWNFRPERIADQFDVPTSEQWYQEGPWHSMVADYSRFLNEFLGEKYREARDLVRSITPNQLVSFRMQHTGDPTYLGPTMIPYPAAAFTNAVDFFEPEAYGRIGDWEKIKPGQFTAAYLRALNPALPVFWAEIGQSCWDRAKGEATPEAKDRVARFYEDFHKMLIASQANGVCFWWYAGGYRTNERSDYGILNPDGTDRPVTRVIREWGPRFREMEAAPEPEAWVEIQNDWAPGGIVGHYEQAKERYWGFAEGGDLVGIRLVSKN